MAISVVGATATITVSQTDTDILTPLGGGLYEFDTNAFRLELKAWEATSEGMAWPRTHFHNTTVTISGITFARSIALIAPWKLVFSPDSQWSVVMDGASNNNFHDVQSGFLVQNQVQVIPQNSAGNTVTETGVSGLTAPESQALLDISAGIGDLVVDVAALTSLTNLLKDANDLTNEQANAEHITSKASGQVILRNTDVMRRWEAPAYEDEGKTIAYGTNPNAGIEAVGMLVEVAWS